LTLVGNSRIAIICTISLSPVNFEETLSTLKFAQRAKKIKASAKINEIVDDKTLIKQYRMEIAELKKKLEEATQYEKQLEELHDIRKQKEKMEEDYSVLHQQHKEQQLIVAGLQEKIHQLTKCTLNIC
jgi:centromeric protein E